MLIRTMQIGDDIVFFMELESNGKINRWRLELDTYWEASHMVESWTLEFTGMTTSVLKKSTQTLL